MLPRLVAIAACAACLIALGSCSNKKPEDELGKDEAVREGLALDLDGVAYNVFITRELNFKITPDQAYYRGPGPKKGETFYGVFLEVCNSSEPEKPRQTARHFTIRDNQGTEFEPIPLPKDNQFAYNPEVLAPEECIPHAGSVADQGPTGGSLLLFKLPLAATENRPLELEIQGALPTEKRQVELDI